METRTNNIKRSLYISNLGLMDNLGMTQILPYIKGLAEKGVEFIIISYEKKEHIDNKAKIKHIKRILDKYDIRWITLQYHHRWGNIYDIFVGLFLAVKITWDENVDIIHARASIPMFFAFPVAKLFGKRIIYDRRGTVRGDFIDDVDVKNICSLNFFAIILDAIDRFFIRHSDAIIVLSERGKRLLKEGDLTGRQDVTCEAIPCCVNMERFVNLDSAVQQALDLSDKFVLTYVGSLGTCYLLDEMIDFFTILKKIEQNAFFLIVSHSDADMINSTFLNKGILRGDYAVVDAAPDEVPGWLNKSKCSVMFIKEVECKIGSSPTKFAESLAAGIPVVVNKNIGDTENLICANRLGSVVESLDEKGYSDSIYCLREVLKDGFSLSERCKTVASKLFSMELGIEKYKRIYESL
ncbi:MAG: glycosyltransferase [Candidatus Omnitrophica bacterium]|nr:glycosyltransferase [Candidatus Omnitrophota bacterium]